MLAARPAAKYKYRPKTGQQLAQMRSQRVERLEYQGYVVPLHPMIGHNLGPGLFDWDIFERRQMADAHTAAWTPPSYDVARRRVEQARKLGLSYDDYALEILERGRYLQVKSQDDI
ncbi:MAG: hypothetical protein COA62_11490 [Rhodobiaceae bacterium]|nr:MAG: hypothetical protein COA62_11490 [Rhodobiaceae bacterium]